MLNRTNSLRLFLAIILLVITGNCVGQEKFSINLLNSIWIADSSFEDSTFSKYKEIGLSKLTTSKDSIKTNQVLWRFADSLNIIRYDPSLRKEKLIGSYHYFYDRTKELLIITDRVKKTRTYRINMVSTGSFILLSKRSDKQIPIYTE